MRRFNNYDLAGQPPVLAWNPIVMRRPGCGRDWPQGWKEVARA
jgi:hypothetical protein